jgi:hypothetical protein
LIEERVMVGFGDFNQGGVSLEELVHVLAGLVVLGVPLSEAFSVLCRRARERRTAPPDLSAALTIV